MKIRVATFNVSLYGKTAGEVYERLIDGRDPKAIKLAAIVQTVRPDVLLVNEIDYEPTAATARLIAEEYFAIARSGRSPIDYPYIYAASSNTGIDSGLDLNGNAANGEATDAWGFGVYPGQYSMAIFSRFPIDKKNIRTFQNYLWSELPDAHRPYDPETQKPYYQDAVWSKLRLSSKNHLDVPIQIGDATIHLLASHPTPPVFDGAEDRNGCRNHDEIRFWVDYLDNPDAAYLRDDRGNTGGLPPDAAFVVLGDLNADPADGDGKPQAIRRLLSHRRVHDPKPSSAGATERDVKNKACAKHSGDPALDTADFGSSGHFRVDYVLPSKQLNVVDAGVFWPRRQDPRRDLISASDHRMVWVEVEVP
ncbi:endonuclease/exonuclease/phosphatase [Rhodopirellula maiorica SM1]|uniref:Endonuclease/exonuclease/phosphatase n=1 Tax=Rhodopirellula maiorica SM1 TaxID=1265738 RepID=M5RUH7_9BACT|nr:endonuclease/exonuclease/phosphatase family protein [Rhodopirellula maiorica]EMI17629.1 endonuclease/exonuclease/phosphatase [Rhodopirellula maiorica SM1]